MGTVQRQTMTLLAYEEAGKGNLDKAKSLLDNANANFPAPNFPIDVYSVYIYTGNNSHVDVTGLYKEVYGEEKARELWLSAFNYYDEELAYLTRFRGEKATGVRSLIQNDLQIISLLNVQASQTLGDNELAAKTSVILDSFKGMMYQ